MLENPSTCHGIQCLIRMLENPCIVMVFRFDENAGESMYMTWYLSLIRMLENPCIVMVFGFDKNARESMYMSWYLGLIRFLENPYIVMVSWCLKPSQPQRITSGLKTNLGLSPSYS